MRSTSLLCVAFAIAGCGNPEPAIVTDRYEPFDAASVSAVNQKLQTFASLRMALEAKDFAAITTAYQQTFQADLKALAAAHPYVSEGAGLGLALDQQARDAIALGTGSTDLSVKEAAEEVIQVIVSRYTFETLYSELKKGSRDGWDRAFAYYGRSPDGKTSASIAGKADERDTEFATRNNDVVWQAFIDGRNALITGETAAVTAKTQTIDTTIHSIFGLSAHHEFAGAADAIKMGMPVDAVEPYSVGKGVFTFLRDYLKTLPGGADKVATIEAELQKGDPTKPDTMAAVNFTLVLTTIDGAFGFKF